MPAALVRGRRRARAGGNVFWVQYATGAVMECAAGGCNGAPASLGTSQAQVGGGGLGDPHLAVGPSAAYWITHDGIVTCPAAGCGGSPLLVASTGSADQIVADEAAVYWFGSVTYGSPPILYRCPFTGCPGGAEIVASLPAGVGTSALVVAAGNLFWDDGNGTLWTCPTAGCAQPSTVVSGAPPAASITSDGESVYWTVLATTGPPAGPAPASVLKCAVTGCPAGPTTIATGQDIPGAIAVDDTSVYWVTQGGNTVMKATPK